MEDNMKKINRWKKIIVLDDKNKIFELDIGEKDQIKQLNKNKKKVSTITKQNLLLASRTAGQISFDLSISANTTIFSRDYTEPNDFLSLNMEENLKRISKKNPNLSFSFNIGQIDISGKKDGVLSLNNYKFNYFNDLNDENNVLILRGEFKKFI